MSSQEYLSKDLSKILQEGTVTDYCIVCHDQRINVHKVILSARSDVFAGLIRSEMVESSENTVVITDASVDVVQQMVNYMYTDKIDTNFHKVEHLLVLANKYNVSGLVNYCGTKIMESVGRENVIKLGMFGELHNCEVLVDYCAKYIFYNMDMNLIRNWSELMKKSPRLHLQVTKIMFQHQAYGLYEIRRMIYFDRKKLDKIGLAHGLGFVVNRDLWLCGLGLNGYIAGNQLGAHIKVFDNVLHCVLDEKFTFTSQAAVLEPVKILFSSPIFVTSGKKYNITVVLSGPTISGCEAATEASFVDTSTEEEFLFTFQASPLDEVHDDQSQPPSEGQIPALYFRTDSPAIEI